LPTWLDPPVFELVPFPSPPSLIPIPAVPHGHYSLDSHMLASLVCAPLSFHPRNCGGPVPRSARRLSNLAGPASARLCSGLPLLPSLQVEFPSPLFLTATIPLILICSLSSFPASLVSRFPLVPPTELRRTGTSERSSPRQRGCTCRSLFGLVPAPFPSSRIPISR